MSPAKLPKDLVWPGGPGEKRRLDRPRGWTGDSTGDSWGSSMEVFPIAGWFRSWKILLKKVVLIGLILEVS